MAGKNKCVGPPNGQCPLKKNDNTVKLCQGDLLLCPSCDKERFSKANISHSEENGLNKAYGVIEGPIINTVLAYIAFSMLSSSCDAIKRAVVGFFTLQQIVEAKDMLWELLSKDVTGDKFHRRDSQLRSEAEAHTSDIISVLQKMDRENKMPMFAVNYKHIGDMPISKPKEMNNIMMCDRLNRLEDTMQTMQGHMDRIIAENINFRDQFEKRSSVCMDSFADIVRKPANLTRNSLETSQTSSMPRNSQDKQKSELLPVSVSKPRKEQDEDGFILPSYNKKHKNKAVIGKSTVCGSLKAAPEPCRDVFVFRTDKTTTVESLKNYLTEAGVLVRDIVLLSHSDAVYSSFKVTVPISQLEKTMDPNIWPQGIGIRRFWNKKNKTEKE
jgi:hypothetical protein